eukprot:4376781-Prymnesium_polylepis.1
MRLGAAVPGRVAIVGGAAAVLERRLEEDALGRGVKVHARRQDLTERRRGARCHPAASAVAQPAEPRAEPNKGPPEQCAGEQSRQVLLELERVDLEDAR